MIELANLSTLPPMKSAKAKSKKQLRILPMKLFQNEVLKHRINLINELENHLLENNTVKLKLYLHISGQEQIKRIDDRKTKPHKRWKYCKKDEIIPKEWDKYREAYHAILNCNQLPWIIIPADKRWYRNYTVDKIFTEHLENLKLEYPNM